MVPYVVMRMLLATVLTLVHAGMGIAAELPAGALVSVSLTHWVSSRTAAPGDPIEAVVIAPVWSDNKVVVSPGQVVRGRVEWAKKVGYGFRRESAALSLVFEELAFRTGDALPIQTRLVEVDNGRERVDEKGVIRGIRATNTPASMISSRLKYLPSLDLYPDPALLAYKLAFPFFPEPEIVFGPGTELWFEVREQATLPDHAGAWHPIGDIPSAQLCTLADQSQLEETRTVTEDKPADVINVLLAGDEADIADAFQAAGWKGSDDMSAGAFLRQVLATIEERAYERQPMSDMEYEHRLPDMEWQKTLNNFRLRHHIRLWKLNRQWNGKVLWAGAATHDIGVNLSLSRFSLVHRIESNIDLEREKVLYDLAYTGCARRFHWLERPDVEGTYINATGDTMRTDGALGVAEVEACPMPVPIRLTDGARPKQPHWLKRYARKQVLTIRHDLIRTNVFYAAYYAGRQMHNTLFWDDPSLAIANALRERGEESPATVRRRVEAPLSCPLEVTRPRERSGACIEDLRRSGTLSPQDEACFEATVGFITLVL